MAKISIIFGLLLIALGVIGFTGNGGDKPASKGSESDTEAAVADISSNEGGSDTATTGDGSAEEGKKKPQYTALIPAGFGLGLLICGLLALKDSLLKHAMHGAALIGVLGALAGGIRGLTGLGKFFSGDPSLNQRAFLFVWIMTWICAAFVLLCVQSFRAARKQKQSEESAS